MASGDPVVQVLEVTPPATLFATAAQRAGGSTPNERKLIWQFDAATVWYLDFFCALRKYGGGGITLTLPWSAASATSGAVVWQAAVRRFQDDGEDIDTAHTYDYNLASADTAPSASGEISYPTIAFTDGADMDSWANEEFAIIRIARLTTDGGDTMTGNAEIWGLIGKET